MESPRTRVLPWILISAVQFLVIGYLVLDGSEPAAPQNEVAASDRAGTAVLPRDGEATSPETVETPPETHTPSRIEAEPENGIEGTTLIGRVVDRATGELLKSGYLSLTHQDTQERLSVRIEKRPFAIAAVPPGRYDVLIRASSGYEEMKTEMEVESTSQQSVQFEMQSSTKLFVAIQTPEGKNLGMVLREGGNFRGIDTVTVVATRQQPPAAFPETENRHVLRVGCGRYRSKFFGGAEGVPERFDGALEIDGGLPVYVSVVQRHIVLATKLVQPGTEEVVFVIPQEEFEATLSTVRLRLIDSETAQPLSGVRVSLSDRQSSGIGVPTETDGRAELAGVPPGIMQLTMHAEGREAFHQFVRIQPGSTIDLGDVRLEPVTHVEGVVVDADGEPATNVSFSWMRIDRYLEGAPLRNGWSARSDSEGKFKLWGLGRGRYLARAQHADGLRAEKIIDTTAGAPEGLRIELQPTTKVTFKVSPTESAPFRIALRDSTGVTRATASCSSQFDVTMGLLPGRYIVGVYQGATLLRELQLDLGETPQTIALP